MKKTVIHIFLFLFVFVHAQSQSFEMDDDVKYIYKGTNSSTPPHEYFQFINLSGDSLHIRWKVNDSLTYYPSTWTLAIQDNETYHNPIIDSNDIVIPDTAGAMDKIILNIFHNASPGYGELVIDLINLDSTNEVVTIKFEMEIYYVNSVNEIENSYAVFPNPVNDKLMILTGFYSAYTYTIHDLSGKMIMKKSIEEMSPANEIPMNSVIPGTYLLTITESDGKTLVFPFIKTDF